MRFGSLYTGIGGWDLGLERAGMTCAWQCENEPYRRVMLREHWPHVPLHDDARDLPASLAPVEVIAAGFPCQPVSGAGRRWGPADSRWEWPHVVNAIRRLEPRVVLLENVLGLRAYLGHVCGDLAALGYDAEWDCVPCAALGAPHLRDRLWMVAYPREDGRAHAPLIFTEALREALGRCTWWESEPEVCRVADGLPGQVHRLAALGDSLSPQISERIGRRVMEVFA